MSIFKKNKENPLFGSQSPETLRKIEEVMEKSAETLVLKNERRIRGIIFLEDDRYLVLSPEGGFEFNVEEVQGVIL